LIFSFSSPFSHQGKRIRKEKKKKKGAESMKELSCVLGRPAYTVDARYLDCVRREGGLLGCIALDGFLM
jgi:hypothetical protein